MQPDPISVAKLWRNSFFPKKLVQFYSSLTAKPNVAL